MLTSIVITALTLATAQTARPAVQPARAADDAPLPEALRRMLESRAAIKTFDMRFWYTSHWSGAVTPGGACLHSATRAADGAIAHAILGLDGAVVATFPDGSPASVVPKRSLYTPDDAGVYCHDDWSLGPDYHPERRNNPHGMETDLRVFGLNPLPLAAAHNRDVSPAALRFGAPGDTFRYETGVDGPIHTVVSTATSGLKMTWRINAEKGWNPECVTLLWDGDELRRESDLQKCGDAWFPVAIRTYENGKITDEIEVEQVSINAPDHPRTLTLKDIGVDAGMLIRRQEAGKVDASKFQVWDREKLVLQSAWQARVERGEARDGPLLAFLKEMRLRGEYLHPDSALLIRKNVEKLTRADYLSEWERYVRAFIERYRLNDEQSQKAFQILRSCQSTADALILRHRDRVGSKSLDEPRAIKEAADRLLRPVKEVFERELKPRLERLPTRAQRRAADAPTSAPASSQPAAR
ncbi:MAG: hypothetical protein CHACPFDD_03057 [Phycisphaerae bacterium]|nr:hypothetical protein [Phycisphaerae bacterium]